MSYAYSFCWRNAIFPQDHCKLGVCPVFDAICQVLCNNTSPDVPSCRIPANTQAVATFLAKADGVLAGLAVADLVFEMVDPTLEVGGACMGGWGHAGWIGQCLRRRMGER